MLSPLHLSWWNETGLFVLATVIFPISVCQLMSYLPLDFCNKNTAKGLMTAWVIIISVFVSFVTASNTLRLKRWSFKFPNINSILIQLPSNNFNTAPANLLFKLTVNLPAIHTTLSWWAGSRCSRHASQTNLVSLSSVLSCMTSFKCCYIIWEDYADSVINSTFTDSCCLLFYVALFIRRSWRTFNCLIFSHFNMFK